MIATPSQCIAIHFKNQNSPSRSLQESASSMLVIHTERFSAKNIYCDEIRNYFRRINLYAEKMLVTERCRLEYN